MKTAVIGMFWRTRAYNGGNRHVLAGNGVQSAIARHSAKSLAGDGGRCRVLAANGV